MISDKKKEKFVLDLCALYLSSYFGRSLGTFASPPSPTLYKKKKNTENSAKVTRSSSLGFNRPVII